EELLRTVRRITDEPATVERSRALDPLRHGHGAADGPGAGHAIALHADAFGRVDRSLTIEPGDHRAGGFRNCGRRVLLHPRPHFLETSVGTEVFEVFELRR